MEGKSCQPGHGKVIIATATFLWNKQNRSWLTHLLFDGKGREHCTHHARNVTETRGNQNGREAWPMSTTGSQSPVGYTRSYLRSKPGCNGTVQSKKAEGKLSWQEHQGILDAKQKLIFFTVAAPEKINFDTELPLYKQITILSNNLICAKPTENSLKNQQLKPPLNQRV